MEKLVIVDLTSIAGFLITSGEPRNMSLSSEQFPISQFALAGRQDLQRYLPSASRINLPGFIEYIGALSRMGA
jgi:hypothetical protein